MRFAFTEDQKLFRDTLRGLLEKECPAEVVRRAWDAKASGRSTHLWSKRAALGAIGLTVPEAHGGLAPELARRLALTLAWPLSLHLDQPNIGPGTDR